MPRKPNDFNKLDKRWNFYVNEIDKAKFILELVKAGFPNCQSAAMRAFMHLYANDEVVREKANAIMEDYIVYKKNGNESLL